MKLDLRKNLSPTDRIARSVVALFVLTLVLGKPVSPLLFTIVILFSLSLFIEALIGY